ncbi:ATP-grasp ribosomal peptide maturase [Nocardiopsis sp. CNT-189]|uniref:ATP-grasp ribosomal peptide maturase n=1 Tax=Nocardiopsis oceanisediminis TaxID=2816862 RepID=UPI003B3BAF23
MATAEDDPAADLVIGQLNRRGVPVVRMDPGSFPEQIGLAAEFCSEGVGGAARTRWREAKLEGVRSVYWRRPSPYTAAPGLSAQDAQWVVDQSRWGFGGLLACLPGALYVNHPWRNRDAEAKPLQLTTAAACGLDIPRTLITNDPGRARSFARAHAPVVYKPLWRGDYRAPDGTGRTVWVRAVEPGDIGGEVAAAAHMFQAGVDKTADVRLTVVGEQMFAVRIEGAPVLDWREAYADLAYAPVRVPGAVAAGVRAYLSALGLAFGAFDFALRRDGAWIMLECNPNGQWSWFPDRFTLPIARALADLLEKGER